MKKIAVYTLLVLILIGCRQQIDSDRQGNINDKQIQSNDIDLLQKHEETITSLEEEIKLLESLLESSNDELEKGQQVNSELKVEIESQKGTIDELQKNVNELSNNEYININDFVAEPYRSYNVRHIHPVINRAVISADEPMRCAPSSDSPSYSLSELADEFNVGHGDYFVADVFLNVENGYQVWVLAHIDRIGIGYFPYEAVEILPDDIDTSYQTEELFSDIGLGMNIDKLYSAYGDYIVLERNKPYTKFTISVIDENDVMIKQNRTGYKEPIVRGSDYYESVIYAVYENEGSITYFEIYSSDIPLLSGYSVGDNSSEVFNYYDDLYTELSSDVYVDIADNEKVYDIGDGSRLGFQYDIDSGEITAIFVWAD